MHNMEKVKKIINDYCIHEYGSEADFSNLKNVPLAYTEDDDGKPIQVSVNLIKRKLTVSIDDKIVCVRKYRTLKEMIKREFECMTFDGLIADAI